MRRTDTAGTGPWPGRPTASNIWQQIEPRLHGLGAGRNEIADAK